MTEEQALEALRKALEVSPPPETGRGWTISELVRQGLGPRHRIEAQVRAGLERGVIRRTTKRIQRIDGIWRSFAAYEVV